MMRQVSCSAVSASCAFITVSSHHQQLRHQSGAATDITHSYLRRKKIISDANVDSTTTVHKEYQDWLNTEQWEGYSDTYLKRHMFYVPYSVKFKGWEGTTMYSDNDVDDCLMCCFTEYGSAAEALEKLEDDILHPEYLNLMKHCKEMRGKIEKFLDERYPALHPTKKTVYDAYLVRRFFFLEDWMERIRMKRKKLVEEFSPEMIANIEKMQHVADIHLSRLRVLDRAMKDDPMLGVLQAGDQYTEEEIAILRHKANYFRNMKASSMMMDNFDKQM